MNTPVDRGHHPDSPSSLQSSEACPHFQNRSGDSAASLAGTLQHKAIETKDFSILNDDEDQIKAVERCLRVEQDRIDFLEAAGFEVEVLREIYLPVCPLELSPPDETGRRWEGLTGGYPDDLIVGRSDRGALGIILDWKCGKMLVTPTKSNLQGMSYALASLQKFPELDEVMVQFYHPYIEEETLMPEYTHTFSRGDMEQMELTIRRVVNRKHLASKEGWDGSLPPVAHTSLCIWCANLALCPAASKLASLAVTKFERLEVPAEIRPAYITDVDSMRKAHQLTGLLEAYAKSVRSRIKDMVLTEGISIPGLKLVTKSDRKITSIAAVREVALAHGISRAEFESCLSMTLGSIEKLVKDKAVKGTGALAVRTLTSALNDVGATKKGKPYSYLVDDKEEEAIDV